MDDAWSDPYGEGASIGNQRPSFFVDVPTDFDDPITFDRTLPDNLPMPDDFSDFGSDPSGDDFGFGNGDAFSDLGYDNSASQDFSFPDVSAFGDSNAFGDIGTNSWTDETAYADAATVNYGSNDPLSFDDSFNFTGSDLTAQDYSGYSYDPGAVDYGSNDPLVFDDQFNFIDPAEAQRYSDANDNWWDSFMTGLGIDQLTPTDATPKPDPQTSTNPLAQKTPPDQLKPDKVTPNKSGGGAGSGTSSGGGAPISSQKPTTTPLATTPTTAAKKVTSDRRVGNNRVIGFADGSFQTLTNYYAAGGTTGTTSQAGTSSGLGSFLNSVLGLAPYVAAVAAPNRVAINPRTGQPQLVTSAGALSGQPIGSSSGQLSTTSGAKAIPTSGQVNAAKLAALVKSPIGLIALAGGAFLLMRKKAA